MTPGFADHGRVESHPGQPWPLLARSEEHTSELQSLRHLVCRLLLEKKKTLKEDAWNETTAVPSERDTRTPQPTTSHESKPVALVPPDATQLRRHYPPSPTPLRRRLL